jgi:hypothetical protein
VPFPLAAMGEEGAISLTWWPNAGLDTVANHYHVVVTCPPGGSPPNQGACGTDINVGTWPNFTLTGLTNGKPYSIAVEARSATDVEMSRSVPAGATPFHVSSRVYLPLAIRGASN